MISRTNFFLTLLLMAVLLLAANSRVDYSQPNIEILPDMKYSPAWTAYEANPHFPNGRTLQAPPPGTIAQDETPMHFEATQEDAERAGRELHNPYSITAIEDGDETAAAESKALLDASTLRGANVYRVYCVPCHGSAGLGDGLVAKRGYPPPPSLLTGASREMQDGQLFHILTYGQRAMPDFSAQLTPDMRWDVINFVRDLQGNAPPETTP